MLPHDSTDTSKHYKNILLSLRDKYQRQYNIFMRNQLKRKQQCYLKPGSSSPATPQQYYPCMDTIERELVASSGKLLRSVNQLDDEDRNCKETCKQSYDIADKYNNCLMKCVKKFEDSIDTVYTSYYEQVIGSDPEYKKLKK